MLSTTSVQWLHADWYRKRRINNGRRYSNRRAFRTENSVESLKRHYCDSKKGTWTKHVRIEATREVFWTPRCIQPWFLTDIYIFFISPQSGSRHLVGDLSVSICIEKIRWTKWTANNIVGEFIRGKKNPWERSPRPWETRSFFHPPAPRQRICSDAFSVLSLSRGERLSRIIIGELFSPHFFLRRIQPKVRKWKRYWKIFAGVSTKPFVLPCTCVVPTCFAFFFLQFLMTVGIPYFKRSGTGNFESSAWVLRYAVLFFFTFFTFSSSTMSAHRRLRIERTQASRICGLLDALSVFRSSILKNSYRFQHFFSFFLVCFYWYNYKFIYW